jgi:hypothetical protein
VGARACATRRTRGAKGGVGMEMDNRRACRTYSRTLIQRHIIPVYALSVNGDARIRRRILRTSSNNCASHRLLKYSDVGIRAP